MSNFTHERFFSLTDQGIEEPAQRTPAWFAMRKGRLSGSKLSRFLFCKTDEERIAFYEEVFEARERPPFTAEQLGWMAWGSKHEDTALKEFLIRKPDIVAYEAPCVLHGSIPWLSSTPDGFYEIFDSSKEEMVVLDTGIIEIKCPAKSKKCNTKVTYYYVPQMFLEMCVSDHKNAIFVSWGPKMLRAWRFEWDDEYWRVLSNMMDNFKNTKNGSDYESFQRCQFELRRECHRIADNAKPLFKGDGWHLA